MPHEATKNQTHRFRLSELAIARREAQRLGCGASDVIRASLMRVTSQPLTLAEIERVRLSRGVCGMTDANRLRVQNLGVVAAAKSKKAAKRRKNRKKLAS